MKKIKLIGKIVIVIMIIIVFFVLNRILFDSSIGFKESNYHEAIEKYMNEEIADYYEEDVTCFTNVLEYGKRWNIVYASVTTKCYYKEEDKLYGHYYYVDTRGFKIKKNKVVDSITYITDEQYRDVIPKYIRKKVEEEIYRPVYLDGQAKEYFDASKVYEAD